MAERASRAVKRQEFAVSFGTAKVIERDGHIVAQCSVNLSWIDAQPSRHGGQWAAEIVKVLEARLAVKLADVSMKSSQHLLRATYEVWISAAVVPVVDERKEGRKVYFE